MGVNREMGNRVKRFALGTFTAILSAALVLSGCSGGTTSSNNQTQTPAPTQEPKKEDPKPQGPIIGGTYIRSEIADAQILLPTLTNDTASSNVTGLVYDSLTTQDFKLDYKPAVAESWSVEKDLIYTFKLRKDVKFHDGTPLTSADVLFTYQYIAHPKYQGVRFGDFTGIKGWKELAAAYKKAADDLKEKKIDDKTADAQKLEAYEKFKKEGGLSAPDPYTYKVELAEPFAPAFGRISGYGILPKHLLEKHQDNMKAAPQAKAPVGSGMYKFVEWVKDDHITLARSTDWKWGIRGKSANIDKIIFKVVPDAQANMVALETGEVDVASIQPDNYDHFKNNVKHVNILEWLGLSYTFLGWNHTNPLFADVKVRQALAHAVPRQQMVDELLKGHGSLANSHGSPARWDYSDKAPNFGYDVKKAEQLLDEAGWKKGADGIRAKDGQKFSFELATNNGNKTREQAAVIVQQALKQIGIEVKINLMEWNAYVTAVLGGELPAYILGWSLGTGDPDPHSIFHSTGGFSKMTGYKSAKVDDLIEQGRKVTDQPKRKEIYAQLQNELANDQVYMFLFFQNTIAGYNKRVAGQPKDLGAVGPGWAFEDWYLSDVMTQK